MPVVLLGHCLANLLGLLHVPANGFCPSISMREAGLVSSFQVSPRPLLWSLLPLHHPWSTTFFYGCLLRAPTRRQRRTFSNLSISLTSPLRALAWKAPSLSPSFLSILLSFSFPVPFSILIFYSLDASTRPTRSSRVYQDLYKSRNNNRHIPWHIQARLWSSCGLYSLSRCVNPWTLFSPFHARWHSSATRPS